MIRRGFTLLEVILASLLASLILASSVGMFTMMQRRDQALNERYQDIAELSRVQATLRRAMQTLVAAPAEEQEQTAGGADAEQPQVVDEFERPRTSAEERERRRREAGFRASSGHRFSLGPLPAPPEAPTVHEQAPQPWRLEVVLMQSPIPSQRGLGGPVRGAFDAAWTGGTAEEPSFSLLWTPLEPEGEPVVLADNLAAVWFAVLVREGWTQLYSADGEREYPRAIRIAMMAWSGERHDWMFEPGTIVGDAP